MEAVAEAVETAYQRRGDGPWVAAALLGGGCAATPLRVTQLDFTEDTTQASTGPVGRNAPRSTPRSPAAEAAAGSLPTRGPRVRAAARKHVETLPELGPRLQRRSLKRTPFCGGQRLSSTCWWRWPEAACVAGAAAGQLGRRRPGGTGAAVLDRCLDRRCAVGLAGWRGCCSLVEVEAARQREYVEMHGLNRCDALR